MSRSTRPWLAVGLFWLSWVGEVVGTGVTPFLEQSFFFDWNKPGQPYPVPVTQQCEVNHIVWSRGSASGPNPTAPYYLQVYTSAYTVPFVVPAGDSLNFDWAVPFAPGTLYQICMFDKFGNTGGCQDTYTVIPSPSTPTCANVTFPKQLEVKAIVNNGPMSQYGWIDQCSDISLQPNGGTGPYTLTVAPSLHPPYNMTSSGDKPINWTLSLDWASQFYISLADSAGNMWSNGPLHAGGGGSIACLSGNTTADPKTRVPLAVTVGSGVGGLALGLLLGAFGAYLLLQRHMQNKADADRFVHLPSGPNTPLHAGMFEHGGASGGGGGGGGGLYQPVPTVSSGGTSMGMSMSMGGRRGQHTLSTHSSAGRPISGYQVEPFMMPGDEDGGQHQRMSVASPTSMTHYDPAPIPPALAPPPPKGVAHGSSQIQPLAPPPPPLQPQQHQHQQPQAGPSRNVYVVHHDGQAAPVTIYHDEGAQVVELPPRYPESPAPAVAASASEAGPSEFASASYPGTDSRSDGGSAQTSQSGTKKSQKYGGYDIQLHQVRQPNRAAKPTQ